MSDIYLNGQHIGETKDGKELVKSIIAKRRQGVLPTSMNACYYEEKNEVQVNTDGGRVRRPLIIVENGTSKLTDVLIAQLKEGKITWQNLLEKGIVEYLDSEEEEMAYIAFTHEELTKKHTHMEIDPMMIVGIGASLLVFPEKNRGDRSNYGSRMVTQAVGMYLHNHILRDDTTSQTLVYPQEPLVQSETIHATGVDIHPAGQNVIIAVMPFYGYNIEDAIVINKSSIERGIGRSYSFRTYVTEANRYWGGQEDEIGFPEASVRGFKSEKEYNKLDPDGIVSPETTVEGSDVVVGKTSPLRFLGVAKEVRLGIKNRRDNSLVVNAAEGGIVDKVIMTESKEGNRLIKVTVRELKIPEVGDKFASRHGQKGVLGIIVPEEDMPFTAEGITPDIIFNAHAIPSRMTIGHLLEIVGGKAGALAGEKINGTAFKGNEEHITKLLKASGMRDDGKETFYNGITGEKIEAQILTGMIYYQRLYHLVSQKMHARSKGPVALLTKQPTEGRSKEGGLRFGEMEKDTLVAHGAAITLKERFSSDKSTIPFCETCGITAVVDKIKNKTYCPLCKGSKIKNVEMAYAFKLLLDEMKSMMIYPQIVMEKEE